MAALTPEKPPLKRMAISDSPVAELESELDWESPSEPDEVSAPLSPDVKRGEYIDGYPDVEMFKVENRGLPIDASIDYLSSMTDKIGRGWSLSEYISQYRQDTDPNEKTVQENFLQLYVGNYKIVKYISAFEEIGKVKLPFLVKFVGNNSENRVANHTINEGMVELIRQTGEACKILHERLVSWPIKTQSETRVFTGFAFEIPDIKRYVINCIEKVKSGGQISFPFCISTSANKEIATRRFTSSPDQIVLEIILPQGSIFPFISTDGIEAEVLLPFGTLLGYVSEKFEDDRHIYVFMYMGEMPVEVFNDLIDRNVSGVTELYKLRETLPRGSGGKRKRKTIKRKKLAEGIVSVSVEGGKRKKSKRKTKKC